MSDSPNNYHPALFCLLPITDEARKIVNHSLNQHLTSRLPSGTLVLDVGRHRSTSGGTIATLGRGEDVDIFMEGHNISKHHCSFEFESRTNAIMLYDRSSTQTTYPLGQTSFPFEHGRFRRVVVNEKFNTKIGVGGKSPGIIQFKIIWPDNPVITQEKIKLLHDSINQYANHPRRTRTMMDLTADLSSTPNPAPGLGTTAQPKLKVRWFHVGQLGSGSFGAVHKGLDVDTGKFLAVKVLKRPAGPYMGKDWNLALYSAKKREVEALSHINHPHIVDYIASQGWEGPSPIPEIVMELKAGNLRSLIYGSGVVFSIENLAQDLCFQMLQALDCLAANNSIHRNVKPENILCTPLLDGRYHFELGDFGICNNAANVVTTPGSALFQAPEVSMHGHVELQTHKMDVWSLFVTILWTLDINGFRTKYDRNLIREPWRAVLEAAPGLYELWEMSIIDPLERASAAQMLIKCFNGNGLVSDIASIPPINQERMEVMMETSPPLPPSRPRSRAMTRPMRPLHQGLPQPNDGRKKDTRQSEPFRVGRINEKRALVCDNLIAAFNEY